MLEKILSGICHGISAGTVVFFLIFIGMIIIPAGNSPLSAGSLFLFAGTVVFALLMLNYHKISDMNLVKKIRGLEFSSFLYFSICVVTIPVGLKYGNIVLLIYIPAFVLGYFALRKTYTNGKPGVIIENILIFFFALAASAMVIVLLFSNIEKKYLFGIGLLVILLSFISKKIVKEPYRHVLWHFLYLHGGIIFYFTSIIIMLEKNK